MTENGVYEHQKQNDIYATIVAIKASFLMKANDEEQHNWKLERNSLDLISNNLLALFHNSFVLKPHFFFVRLYAWFPITMKH